jgi:hypothetical protein
MMPRQEVTKWVSEIPSSFSDPITGIRAETERELTAVVSIRHQLGLLEWGSVRLLDVISGAERRVSDFEIGVGDMVLSEYPLFAIHGREMNRWGRMMPDLLFTDRECSKLTLVEAKIDNHFTFSDDPPDGQVTRYLEYLESSNAKGRSLIVICPKFNTSWYAERMRNAVVALKSTIPTHVMEWESIMSSNRG